MVAGLLVLTILPDILFEDTSKKKKGKNSKGKSSSDPRRKSEKTAPRRLEEYTQSETYKTKQEDES